MYLLGDYRTILNDLFQRGHIPKPDISYTKQIVRVLFPRDSVIYWTCKIVLNNDKEEQLLARATHLKKAYALEECCYKIVTHELKLSYRKVSSIKRSRFPLIDPAWRELNILFIESPLTRYQIYFSYLTRCLYVCFPEADIQISNQKFGQAAIDAAIELKIFLLKNQGRQAFRHNTQAEYNPGQEDIPQNFQNSLKKVAQNIDKPTFGEILPSFKEKCVLSMYFD